MKPLALALLVACSGSTTTGPIDLESKPDVADGPCQADACTPEFRRLLQQNPPDFAAADRFARDACDRGVEEMCARLGRLHAIPVWPGSDPAKALAGFETSCKRGHQRGCLGVGKVLMVHEELGKKHGGLERAMGLFEAGCDAQIGEACYYLGMFYFLGRGVKQDRKKALGLLQKRAEYLATSCDAGVAWDCGLAAELHARGEAFSDESFTPNPNPKRALAYAEKGCAGDHGGSCLTLGMALLETDRVRAIDMFAKGCELLDADACAELAKRGAGPRERPRLYGRACALGGGSGCFALAEAKNQGGDNPRAQAQARELQRRGCALGYPPSCRYHANMIRTGHGGPKDEVAARRELIGVCQMIQRGTFCADQECVTAMAASCAEAGEMMLRGIGGAVETERGKALLKIACERGASKACEMAK